MTWISWVAVKVFFKKAWTWIKKYWQLFVGMLIPILVWIFTRRPPDLSKVLDRVREDHQKELEVINRTHREELEKRDAAVKRYTDTMAEVERKFSESQKTLTEKKKREVEKILKDHGDDPDEITRRLSEATGFQIHVE
jgi:CII-binding regulator of phage lambda lysogenization HflD